MEGVGEAGRSALVTLNLTEPRRNYSANENPNRGASYRDILRDAGCTRPAGTGGVGEGY